MEAIEVSYSIIAGQDKITITGLRAPNWGELPMVYRDTLGAIAVSEMSETSGYGQVLQTNIQTREGLLRVNLLKCNFSYSGAYFAKAISLIKQANKLYKVIVGDK